VVDRKDRRKAERAQKKQLRAGLPPSKRPKTQHLQAPEPSSSSLRNEEPISRPKPFKAAAEQEERRQEEAKPKPKSILKTTRQKDKHIPATRDVRSPSPPPRRISRAVQDKLAEDDEEIAALERKLGIKSKKDLPQAFKDDGLDELLAGIDELVGTGDDALSDRKKRKAEESDWLEQKRKKARQNREQKLEEESEDDEDDFDDEDIGDSFDESVESGLSMGSDEFSDDDEGNGSGSGEEDTGGEMDEEEEDDFGGFASDVSEDEPEPEKKVRENPYVAPIVSGSASPAKYIPPSLRKPAASDSEHLVRLRRQTQGLVNKLTEANLISILGEAEKLYRDNARQHVTSILVDLLLTSVCEPTALPDTLIILPAGFIAAVYKIIGTDFGAQVIQRIVELFEEQYANAIKTGNHGPAAAASDSSKETSNLITLLSELYNFQVVGSNLMFDYIRMFLGTLSELNAELLLKMIRASGPQLRQDDPSSLKDIVNMLRPAVEKVGEANMSVRTKFMIETINDLKNNKMKTGAAASAVVSEHTIRMKKTLGTLNTRSLKGTEPLRIGLKDIQASDKKGKWWLVGARWAGNEPADDEEISPKLVGPPKDALPDDIARDAGTSDLGQLAREQRMNTDIRRAIFITIMSASDFQDAYMKLNKLKLKKVQELEIPKVLIHCSSAEASYNPYYTLIAKKLCGDRKLKMAFQFNLWDLFKKMGEGNEEEDVLDEDDEDALSTRHIVNLAKMFGSLIVDGGLTITVLKNLNLTYLQPKTKTFMEVLFITMFLQSQRQAGSKRDETTIVNLMLRVKDAPAMTAGLQYFIKKVIRKTDIAGDKVEKATIKWACKIATETLQALATADAV
jgi:nucleolar MIF4G domain-containing protein 1